MARDTTTAENIEVRMPRQCTTAKPRTAPGTISSERPTMKVATFESRTAAGAGRPGAPARRAGPRGRGGAAAELLADALVDQHVGVDRHAERERDGRDA